ncbi:MAPEG family protein [Actibacterium sp. D379-3]
MTTELTVLALAGLLQVLQIFIYSGSGRSQVDPKLAFGPRDTPIELTGVPGRLKRAMDNHFEGLILFTLAVVVVTLGGQATPFTAGCAWVYLGARVLYVPAYALGLAPWRSMIWSIGLIATIAMIVSALF